MRKLILILVFALTVCAVQVSFAGVLGPLGFTENFDSMGPTGTAAPADWTIGYLGTSGTKNQVVMSPYGGNGSALNAKTTLVVDNGSSTLNVPTFWNFGSTGSSDRALGTFARTNPDGDHVMQVALTNGTGHDLSWIQLDYTGEQWRKNQCAASSEKLQVLYSATSATDGFVYMGTAFDFTAPQNTLPVDVQLDGNGAANRTAISGVFTLPSVLKNGDSFWIRWHDWNDNATRDHYLAIDDVSVVPEPSTLALMATGMLAAMAYVLRRRR